MTIAIIVIVLVLALCGLPLVCGTVAELVHRSRQPW